MAKNRIWGVFYLIIYKINEMNVKIYVFFLIIMNCFLENCIAQETEIPLSDINFRKGGDVAKLGGNCYQLTSDKTWSSGAIWYPRPINLKADFEMEVELFLGCSEQGADGIVFIFSPELKIGYGGEGMGFSGLSASLGIEFDTYQNYHLGDPKEDHIAILRNGSTNHRYNLAGPIGLKTNLEDCKNHSIKITWKAKEKELLVFLDGYPVIDLQKNIIAAIFNNNPVIYWGFTAATGGKRNQHKVCFEKLVFEETPRRNTFTRKERTTILKGDITTLNEVLFQSGSATLKKGADAELAKLLTLLKEHPEYNLNIYGHTDSTGDDKKNEILSQIRAESIVNFLISNGIARDRLLAQGLGETYPIASNNTVAGRLKNRRIEIYLYKPIP